MFADMVDYGSLQAKHVPFYIYEFMEHISRYLNRLEYRPEIVNTWGDAIFVAMDKAVPTAECALALQDAIESVPFQDFGLENRPSVRIALHAGPVFEGKDPLTGRLNLYGAHVTQAARIEPITVPDHVYASEQFAALLACEQAEMSRGASDAKRQAATSLTAEYVGTLSLPKTSTHQAVYRIVRRVPT